jgi:hypothetical protein
MHADSGKSQMTAAQLARRIAELKAYARMAPTAQARDEIGQLVKHYLELSTPCESDPPKP